MKTDLYGDNLPEIDRNTVEWFKKQAEDTPANDKGLAIHTEAIATLRAKGYSYREIATWFTERGCKVNHVDVWRAHKNSLDVKTLFAAAEHDEEWREYLSKKQEGNSITYEDKDFPEDAEANPASKPATAKPNPRPKRERKSK